MANSPTSLETQIDSFLEQFKRSASKAMEERIEWPDGPSPGAVVRSRSSCFTLDAATVDNDNVGYDVRSKRQYLVEVSIRIKAYWRNDWPFSFANSTKLLKHTDPVWYY
ncbi:hypothetical protein RR46_15321 [Papilio xuthus]|uniref:Uncharacterized protein n=1 Tax=Papilio xuthus TaxID=66420 RepID=A0A194PEW0_PAPXU|nr:hypothetical protein RR46_15321 [Papilio xuthus]